MSVKLGREILDWLQVSLRDFYAKEITRDEIARLKTEERSASFMVSFNFMAIITAIFNILFYAKNNS